MKDCIVSRKNYNVATNGMGVHKVGVEEYVDGFYIGRFIDIPQISLGASTIEILMSRLHDALFVYESHKAKTERGETLVYHKGCTYTIIN